MTDALRITEKQRDLLREAAARGAIRFEPHTGKWRCGRFHVAIRRTVQALHRQGLIERAGDSGRDLLDYVITERGRLAVQMMAAA